ncbi:MAG: fumarate hydratase [Candidatus Lokiarchaeota archaeon]|nr:fumarate hydratase [Candidatus Lokiarchaeota archaeon]
MDGAHKGNGIDGTRKSQAIIDTPFTAEKARALRAGDVVFLSGTIVTARDATHERLLDATVKIPDLLAKALGHKVLYHCGPVAKKNPDGTWDIKAAGPTTSARMSVVENDVMKRHDVHAIIGKAGMHGVDWHGLGGCYLAFVGGAALLARQAIKRIVDVAWIDLGIPEAAWILEVERFGPLIVAQDAHGGDLYRDVVERARKRNK